MRIRRSRAVERPSLAPALQQRSLKNESSRETKRSTTEPVQSSGVSTFVYAIDEMSRGPNFASSRAC